MPFEIKERLLERFAAPLSEFYNRRIIFWYDGEGEFAEQVDGLTLPDVTIIKLTGCNNFAVKKMLTVDDLTSNYLIYRPFVYEKPQDNWLLDVELYSEEFRADLISMWMEEMRIEPTSIMRKTVIEYKKFFDNKERRAKLRKIGRDYHAPGPLHIDIMAVLCEVPKGSAQDVIIAVLMAGLDKENNERLDSIESFGNIEIFWRLIGQLTGYINTDAQLDELAAHIFISAMSQTMSTADLKGLERYISDPCKAYCYQLVNEWQRGDHRDTAIEIFHRIEQKLHLADRFDNIDIDVLLKCDTFPAINESILKRFFGEINENIIRVEPILKAFENKCTAAWYDLTSDYFDCLYNIAKMQEYHLKNIEEFHVVEPKGIWNMYTDSGYLMDSYYRHFHFSFANTLEKPNPLLDDLLKKCADVAEGLYQTWFLTNLTSNWTNAISNDLNTHGYVSDIPKQRSFYNRYVSPSVKSGNRIFVIISDALRYEVASELAEDLNRKTKGKATLESMQAIFPGITKFGMAALLPAKELTVNEKLDVFLGDKATNDTAKRGVILSGVCEASIALKFDDFLQMKKQERRDLLSGKEIIYIYHNHIDAIGDKAPTEKKVFEACDKAINELTGIVRTISNDLSGTNIIITADHGFLYTYKPLDESQKISRQTFDGEVYELGRRYALVSPDTTTEHLLPVKTEHEIGGLAMKGYTPQDTVRIKISGGGENYVHGGISLQEMVVPVIVYKGMRAGYKNYVEVTNPGLSLISEGRKISNLMFSLDFLQKQPVGGKVQPCEYVLCFKDDSGTPVSDSQTVKADKTSSNASERVVRVRFNLKSLAFDKNKLYRLVISNDIDVPEEEEFQIDIAFADDFGFVL